MTTGPHPSPRDEPEAFARAFVAALTERFPAWFGRGDVEMKEARLAELHGDYAAEVIFRWEKAPDVA